MKKIILFLLMSIIGVISVGAYDLKDTVYYDTQIPNMYMSKVKNGVVRNGAPFLLHLSNGTLVYCIDPFSDLATSYEGYYGYNSMFGLTKDQITRMNVIAHYGYGYPGHSELKWYGITQYMIWTVLNLDDIYFTDSYHGNRIVAYTSEIDEMQRLVNSYYVQPSFSGNIYNFSIKSNYTLEDNNNVLSNYEVTTNSNDISVSVVNNRLNINALKEGTYKITFTKKNNNQNYVLYYGLDGQNLLLPGKIDDISTTITVNAYKGKIQINKHDIESDYPRGTTFNGGVYGLYKENIDVLVDTVTLDENGQAIFDDLQLTDYYIKEITAPTGYQLNDNKYSVHLSMNEKEKKIDVYDEIIKKEVSINKYYGNYITDNYYLESDALFELYDSNNNLINTFRTNENGNITLTLTYGEYILKQLTTKEGYLLSDDIKLSIIDCINESYDLYDYEDIKYGSIEINKWGSDNKLLNNVEFELYAKEDIFSKDGSILYHKDELITTLKTINGYIKYDKLYYGNYYLKEIKTEQGYLLNNKIYDFSIDKELVSLDIINDKIVEFVEPEIYLDIPDTGKYDIDYMASFGVILVLFGYCFGIYVYKKYIGTC